MPSDFDFLDDDLNPRSKTPPAEKIRPIVERLEDEGPPRAEAVEDDEVPLRNGATGHEPSERREPKPSNSERRPKENRQSDGAGKTRRKTLPMLLGASALLVLGTAATLLLAYRNKETDTKDKFHSGTVAAAAVPKVAPKKEAGEANRLAPEVMEKVMNGTVLIQQLARSIDKNGKEGYFLVGEGSGFVESKSRLIITNAHVVGLLEPADDTRQSAVMLVFNSGVKGKEFTIWGRVDDGDVDVDNDLAVVHPLQSDEPHTIPNGLEVKQGPPLERTQTLFTSGFPLGSGNTREVSIRQTQISSFLKDDYDDELRLIQCEGGTTFGNSGGPFVNLKGEVVGVAVSRFRDNTLNFAVPSDKVLKLLGRPTTGSAVNPKQAAELVDYHNDVRKEVGVKPVKWSRTLASFAQSWANRLADEGEIKSRPAEDKWAKVYGENVGIDESAIKVAEKWHSEFKDYKDGTAIPKDRSKFKAEHYTQMVWQDTTEIGVGVAKIKKGLRVGQLVIVCDYNPHGNIPGKMPYDPARD